MGIKVTHQSFFVPGGRCKKLMMLVESCKARDQMWQCGFARREQFVKKAQPYIKKRIAVAVGHLGYSKWWVERTGSNILNDVVYMRKQSFRIYMEK